MPIDRAVWLLIASVQIAVVLYCQLAGNGSWRRLSSVAVVTLFIPVGAIRHQIDRSHYDAVPLMEMASDDARPTIIDGIIDAPPVLRRHPLADQPSRRDQSPWQTHLSLRVQRIKVGQRFEAASGRVLTVVDERCDELRPGDSVRVFGAMHRFGAPTNPGESDLRDVYRRRRMHARVNVDSSDQIVLRSANRVATGVVDRCWFFLNRMIANVSFESRRILLRYTGERTSPLAIALVIGQREFVDGETRDLLLVTGTAHLLSVSGLHLAIIVVLAGWSATLLRLPHTARIGWIIAVCLIYTAITGGRPPVTRAAVLVSTFMFAVWIRRPSQPINTLSLAALILVLWNPGARFQRWGSIVIPSCRNACAMCEARERRFRCG